METYRRKIACRVDFTRERQDNCFRQLALTVLFDTTREVENQQLEYLSLWGFFITNTISTSFTEYCQQHLDLCKERHHWEVECQNFVFSKKSRFCLDVHDGRRRVRFRRGEPEVVRIFFNIYFTQDYHPPLSCYSNIFTLKDDMHCVLFCCSIVCRWVLLLCRCLLRPQRPIIKPVLSCFLLSLSNSLVNFLKKFL